MKSADVLPPILVDLFVPPDELRGVAGALCGFSASARFLEKAMSRFTRMNRSARQHDGERPVTLFLDPRVPPFRPMDIVGLHQRHPRPEHVWARRAKCMHAKVALLAFGRSPRQPPEHFRIVVSTGNWTEDAAVRSLDLVWSLDIAAGSKDDAARADLIAVARFFETLSMWYEPITEPHDAVAHLLTKAREFAGRPVGASRFLSSFDGPMIDLLAERLERQGVRRRNFMLCGSGFFEPKAEGMPVVLRTLAQRLRAGDAPCLTPSSSRSGQRVVVNPATCGAVRDWVLSGAPEADGWMVHAPADPRAKGTRQNLHAKFIFLAARRKRILSGGWLLLGSGNFSPSGFLRPAATAANGAELENPGNIEAGVLFPVLPIPEEDLGTRFPVGYQLTAAQLNDTPPSDEDEENPKAPFSPSPPVVALVLDSDARTFEIVWSSQPQPVSLQLNGAAWTPVGPGTRTLAVPPECPAQVPVRWKDGETAVPVIGDDGSWCRVPFTPRPFHDLLDRLLAFSTVPADDGPSDDDTEYADCGGTLAPEANRQGHRDFAAHRAMRLVEAIADRNHRVEPEFLLDWFRHLRFLLLEGVHREQREAWKALGVNFLACLAEPGFAPPAVHQDAELKADYDDLLATVTERWELAGYDALSTQDAVTAA